MKKLIACLLYAAICCFGFALADGSLPPYAYTGNDPVEAAVAAYTAQVGQDLYLVTEGSVSIPAPVIIRMEETDNSHILVYGNFWVFNYELNGKTLECISGGEAPAIMTLEKTNDGWTVTAVDQAGDGEEYAADIRRLSHGDKELEKLFFAASYGDGDLLTNVRHQYIQDYVIANNLDVEAYKDYGWDPIPLFSEPVHTTVTALATEINPDHLFSVAVNARITGYSSNENMLTLELIIPETFSAEDILGLAIGDAIYTQGKEVLIQTLTENSGYLVINEGEYEFSEGSVWLYESLDGNYQIADWHDNTWTTLATLKVPVTDTLLLLDDINPSTGEIQYLPTVHPASEFLKMLKTENEQGGPGFATNNVYVVFDGAGQLALIQRYYVPWQ